MHNITGDVYSGDIGDLATAAYLFGVAHPPGYPLLTFLGFLFSKLPLPIAIISRISLVSVLSAFFGTVIYFIFAIDSLMSVSKEDIDDKKKKTNNLLDSIFDYLSFVPVEILATAIISTAVLAFSYYYWLYAEVPEVFALSNFFLLAIYFAGYKFYKTLNYKYLYLTAFIAGLSLTNQHAIVTTFPGIAVLILPVLIQLFFFQKNKNWFYNLSVIFKSFVVFLCGLIPYLYVFIAAAFNPQINWMGQPTIHQFIRLLLRLDYPMFQQITPLAQKIAIESIYFSTINNTFSFIILALIVVGVIWLFKKDTPLFQALLTGIIFSGPLFIFVITPDITNPDELGVIERFFMQSSFLLLLFLPFGIMFLIKYLSKFFSKNYYALLFLFPVVIIIMQMFYYNNQKTDLSKTKIGYNFAYDILAPLPKNSVVFLLGDTATLNSWYAHYVLGLRPDVDLLGAYGDRSDLEKELIAEYKKNNPKTKLKDEKIFISLLPEISKKRRVFSMYNISVGNKNYNWVPLGLIRELVPVSKLPTKDIYIQEIENIISNYHIIYRDKMLLSDQNIITPSISRQFSLSFADIGDYFYLHYNDNKNAYKYYNLAQAVDKDHSLPIAKIAILQGDENKCKEAIKNIDQSIAMYKVYRPYYTFALRIYNKCKIEKAKINDLKVRYKNLFEKDLEKDPHY